MDNGSVVDNELAETDLGTKAMRKREAMCSVRSVLRS